MLPQLMHSKNSLLQANLAKNVEIEEYLATG
jgi:hypothetical protein